MKEDSLHTYCGVSYGITGNYYLFSPIKRVVEDACDLIDKSRKSIYWNDKFCVFVARIKSSQHKAIIKNNRDKFSWPFQIIRKDFKITGSKSWK